MPKLARLASVLLSLSALQIGFGQNPSYSYTTVAGVGLGTGTKDGTGGVASVTLFNYPIGAVCDSSGNLYVADSSNQVIRKISTTGEVSTFVGVPQQASYSDGTGTYAYFDSPQAPVMDSSGNIYVVEYTNHDIRKITPEGVVTTFAGVSSLSGSADGTGTEAYFYAPRGLAIDSAGNFYVADTGNHTIRKITSAGVVTTLAGTAGTSGDADGTGTNAKFNTPIGIAVDSSGNVYVGDTGNHTIRKITAAGVVTTFAGTTGTAGYADGTGTNAQFNFPACIRINSSGNLIVADYNNSTIRQVTPAGVVTTIAGSALQYGRVDGTGSAARFDHPSGVTLDSSGNIYVTDYISSLIRKVTPAGVVTTIAGAGGAHGYKDGTGTIVSPGLFNQPWSLAADAAGNAYVVDTSNHVIKKVTPEGVVTTFAGSIGFLGSTDGAVGTGRFRYPEGIVLQPSTGKFYVSDAGNHLIRVVAPDGTISTLAGQAYTSGSTDGTGTDALFYGPTGIAVDAAGNVFVADTNNCEIRRITPAGVVTTFAGQTDSGTTDGTGTEAQFNYPQGLAFDAAGNLFVADTDNHTIRKITPEGVVSTYAGIAGTDGADDGPVASATFYYPASLAFDSAGNLYVLDRGNELIRMITPDGVVSTIGGQVGASGSLDGIGDNARFSDPNGIAVDAAGNLYIADTYNSTLRKGTLLSSTGGTGSGLQTYRSTTAPTGDLSIGDLWYKTDSAGSVTAIYSWNGTAWVDITGTTSGSSTYLSHPVGLAIDTTNGYLYVADTGNHAIKKIVLSSGAISTVAGTVGTSGSADGTGTAATFNSPQGVAWDSATSILYVADTGNATIRAISSEGVVTTFAGSAAHHGYQDGTGTDAYFTSPVGITVDSSSNVYVTDPGNATIRLIDTDAVVTTYAGKSQYVGDADGTGTSARFTYPSGMSIDSSGDLYLTDTYSHTIRAVTPSTVGTVTTKAGVAGISGYYDGVYANAYFNLPHSVTYYSSDGSLYVADTGNNTIRRVNSSTVVSTVAGVAGVSGSRDTADGTPLFNQPEGIVVDGSGNLYVADTGNSVIRKITYDGTVTTLTLTAASSSSDSSSSGGGGGGAPSGWFLGLLAALSLLRRLQKRK